MVERAQADRAALVLLSGSLDSRLASRLARSWGLDVRHLHVATGFQREDYAVSARDEGGGEMESIDLFPAFLAEARRCHDAPAGGVPSWSTRMTLLFAAAAERARASGFPTVITGDVVGQRRAGTGREDLSRLDEAAGLAGRVLRPLCGGFLPPTEAERRGQVTREMLGHVHGRSRRGQFALAAKVGLSAAPTPSGSGWRFDDPRYAARLADLLAHAPDEAVSREDVALLDAGRHFRVSWRAKVVVGRDEADGRRIEALAAGRPICRAATGGAEALVTGQPRADDLDAAARLAARYSRARATEEIEVLIERAPEPAIRLVRPASEPELDRWRV